MLAIKLLTLVATYKADISSHVLMLALFPDLNCRYVVITKILLTDLNYSQPDYLDRDT